MRIKRIAVAGFRGFNEERVIDFHNRLTLIYAPNSYGKTSISEAFEFLLYGVTSKVEAADSKEEYKGSCRNLHFPASQTPSIRLTSTHSGTELVFECQLDPDEIPKRFIEQGSERVQVEEWPLPAAPRLASRPFILQHALKQLLLAKPDERFRGLARLLGLDELERIHSSIIALCTKPEKAMPKHASNVTSRVGALHERVKSQPSLARIKEEFSRKERSPEAILKATFSRAASFLPVGAKEAEILPGLLKLREEAIGRVFAGHVLLPPFSPEETEADAFDIKASLSVLSEDFVQRYSSLSRISSLRYIEDRARFLDIGSLLLHEQPLRCPFCGKEMDDLAAQHIQEHHALIATDRAAATELAGLREAVRQELDAIRGRLSQVLRRHTSKSDPFMSTRAALETIARILLPVYGPQFDALERALDAIVGVRQVLEASYDEVTHALASTTSTLDSSTEDRGLVRPLVDSIVHFAEALAAHRDSVAAHATAASDAEQLLQHELDRLAGTEDLSVLVDLIESRSDLIKEAGISRVIESLRSLRRTADGFVAARMHAAVSGALTAQVLRWYDRIRTQGDPDVHFDGFDMDRTKKGDLKARRVQVKARSYGQQLVSAVSSLSESKLNALGLCMSIAANLDPTSPFEFLIIDDPIQSLDAEHETQFVQVIRSLAEEESKQIVLLSHNRNWLESVRTGCRSLNGLFYEITGYTIQGPHIVQVPWERWQERLGLVDAITKDQSAGAVRLQQAEEEIRVVIADLASELYLKHHGVFKSPHSLNGSQISKMITECGIPDNLRDRISQTFETTDDAHHTPKDYTAVRQRIAAYHSWAHELASYLHPRHL